MKYVFKTAAFMGGLGAGMRGFLEAQADLAEDQATFSCVGSIDFDAAACADFQLLTGSKSLCADMHELAPADLKAFMPECPDAIFTSPPCKGFSRLLSHAKSLEPKYQRLNELVYRGIFLACETWAPKRPALIVLENVPGIVSRGKDVLDRAKAILQAYGYVIHEGQHDCGEIGNLAQHRKRYLLVARLPSIVTAFVHKPPKHRVRACGEVLETLPVPRGPEAEDAGVMHRLPNIQWDTWVKLAHIPAGGDWRDLPAELSLGVDGSKYGGSPGLMKVADPSKPFPTVTGSASVSSSNACAAVADGRVGPNRGVLGILDFAQPSGVIPGGSLPHQGRYSVADPRTADLFSPLKPGQPRREVHARFAVADWERSVGTIAGTGSNGVYAVSDPRSCPCCRSSRCSCSAERRARFNGNMKVKSWADPMMTVAGAVSPNAGAPSVADPRPVRKPRYDHNMQMTGWTEPTRAVTPATHGHDSGAIAVAEPRVVELRNGQYGVISWQQAAAAVIGNSTVDNGPFAVADPREGQPPLIIAADGCWHRPLSTLELAALQGLPARLNGKALVLAGTKTSAWRERIGNAVPVGAGRAIATSLLKALLASKVGGWFLSSDELWVRQRDYWPEQGAHA